MRASFLPGTQTVRQKLDAFAMHEMDITQGAVLERGCVYIIPLLEMLDLRHRTSATGNPKSSTGRLDVFTRLITDHGVAFDQVPEQYRGQLFAEVSPRTFSVLVRTGSRLSQLRMRRGKPPTSDEPDAPPAGEYQLVEAMDPATTPTTITSGVPVSVDLEGRQSGGIVGYRRAKTIRG